MVTVRLSRGGGKKTPYYHIIVTDSRNRRDGRYIERLGFYNPVARGQQERLRINMERARHWLSQGAKTSATVARLIRGQARQEHAAQ